ncbi:MAG: transposase [Bacteroidota bacterium]
MLHLPLEFQAVISLFSHSFRGRTWHHAQQLLIGAIICPGSRTVSNVLRVLGLDHQNSYYKFHRVLSRAKWSALCLSNILLKALVKAFLSSQDYLVFGIDETIERRRGAKNLKRGIYRDAVRSSASHFVKCSGLRWMSLMLLTPLPWLSKGIYWALPLLTALCPSKRYYEKHSRKRAKKLTDRARQMILWLGRYAKALAPNVYLVGDGSYATYELFTTANQMGVGLVSRLKHNARLFHPPAPQPKSKRGRKPKTGKRMLSTKQRLVDKRVKWNEVVFSEWYGQQHKKMLITSKEAIWDSNKGYRVPLRWVLVKDPQGKLDPVLLASNDLSLTPIQIVQFAVRRWRVEVTFAEVRRHLGVETQRQWSELAIERTTPVLMAMMSIVCLLAKPLYEQGKLRTNAAAWYQKSHFTFSDILQSVRREILAKINFPTSTSQTVVGKLTRKIRYLERIITIAVA